MASGGQGGWGVPGVGSTVSTSESELLWGSDHARSSALWQSGIISSAAADAGNTPTTELRPGLIVGIVTSSGEYEEWDADASDGTQDIAGIVDVPIRTTDYDGTAQDRVFRILRGKAAIRASKLLIQGTALTSHVDEFLARRQLHAAGFVLDDDPLGYKAGASPRTQTVSANTTVTEAENGTTFFDTATDSTFTLPTIHPGLEYEFVSTGVGAMTIASSEGDNMVVPGDASADSVTLDGEISNHVKVRACYVSTTPKWITDLDIDAFYGNSSSWAASAT